MHLEPTVFILADDLTGATDSAAPFAALGLTTRVALKGGKPQERPAQIFSYALDTRNLPAEAAVRRLTAVLGRIPQSSSDIPFLKIDSAGRGAIGAGVLTALDESICEWALVAPAFPAQGRSVRGGILRVAAPCDDEVNLQAQVPLKMLFPDSAQPALAHISCGSTLTPAMSEAVEGGRRILLCDAETEDDLANLVDAARQVQRGRILWCGAAALARAVARSYFFDCSKQTHTAAPFHAGRCALLFVGTPHAATNAQMEALLSMRGVLHVDSRTIPEKIPEKTRCLAVRMRCGEPSDLFVQRMFNLTQRYGGVSGLVLTGGDTASMALKALGAQSILLKNEVATGIPWGILEGGLADGIRAVTKSGGFGKRSALVDVINFLEQPG